MLITLELKLLLSENILTKYISNSSLLSFFNNYKAKISLASKQDKHDMYWYITPTLQILLPLPDTIMGTTKCFEAVSQATEILLLVC